VLLVSRHNEYSYYKMRYKTYKTKRCAEDLKIIRDGRYFIDKAKSKIGYLFEEKKKKKT